MTDRRGVLPLWLVWLVAIALIFAGLGHFAILDNNEGLYAEIPREMLAAADWRGWIIPHLNGLPYMEKPPLLYWLTALSFSLFGQNEFAARLVPAVSSLACVGMLLRFSRQLGHERAGRLAALMFVSGVGVLAMSRVLMFDMLLTALLTAALMQAYRFLLQHRAANLRWSYAFLALAVLAKGFVALVLFGLVILVFVLLNERTAAAVLRAIASLFNPVAVLVFFLIAAPWHVAASLVEPVFAWFYFINEHVLRFLGKREPHDYYGGAWWYYLPRMAIYLFPWCFLLLLRLAPRAPVEVDRTLGRFLFLAWLMPLLFFSVSGAKANYYLVAVMPFAALHLALMLESRAWVGSASRIWPPLAIAVTAGLLTAVAASREVATVSSIAGFDARVFLLLFFGGLCLLALALAVLSWKYGRSLIAGMLILSAWTVGGLGLALAAMEPVASTRSLVSLLQQTPERKVFLYRDFEKKSSLAFYLRHPVAVIEPRSNDLFWGNRLQPNQLLISQEQFLTEAASALVTVIVTDEHALQFQALAAQAQLKQVQLQQVQRVGNVTVFANQGHQRNAK